MPKKEGDEQIVKKCPECGRENPEGSEKCEGCSASLTPSAEEDDASLEELMSVPGVGEAKARTLHGAGYRTVKDLQEADHDELAAVKGIGDKLASKIIKNAQSLTNEEEPEVSGLAEWLSGNEDGLSMWLSGEEQPEGQRQAATAANPPSATDDSLAKWLAGGEETIDSWLDQSGTAEAPGEGSRAHPQELLEKEAAIIEIRENLRQMLKQFEKEGFNPQAIVEELARVKAEVETERSRSIRLEEELENVKRGSIAVIKFIKKQQGSSVEAANLADKLASEMALRENLEVKIMELEGQLSVLRENAEQGISSMPPDSQDLKRREIELTQKIAQLEAYEQQLRAKEDTLKEGLISYAKDAASEEAANSASSAQLEEYAQQTRDLYEKIHSLEGTLAQTEIDLKHAKERASLSESSEATVTPEILQRLEEAQKLERSFSIREQEIERLKEELRVRDDEMKKLKEPLAYKEQEIIRREEDLMYRERLMQEELRRVAQQKAEMTSTDEITLKKRLEELQGQITEKEQEIRNKEKYLSAKEDDLRAREQGLITDEIERREQDRLLELKQEKVKTGTTRLDDLLLGGIPFGSNVLIYGPPFTGKEVLINTFLSEGLKKGVPAIWVLTEKSAKEIRDEMEFVLSGYEEYEKKGLVRYVDTYSRSMGDESEDEYTLYIEAPTDYESIQKAIEKIAKEFRKEHEYYRMGFRSISTLIAYLDPNTAFRFLSPVVGRRKRDRAVSFYTIEKGVHGEQEIQMLGSLMDGMVEFKVENLNTFLAVKGISEVQSRAFIRYTATKSGLNIGSFSLDHIR